MDRMLKIFMFLLLGAAISLAVGIPLYHSHKRDCTRKATLERINSLIAKPNQEMLVDLISSYPKWAGAVSSGDLSHEFRDLYENTIVKASTHREAAALIRAGESTGYSYFHYENIAAVRSRYLRPIALELESKCKRLISSDERFRSVVEDDFVKNDNAKISAWKRITLVNVSDRLDQESHLGSPHVYLTNFKSIDQDYHPEHLLEIEADEVVRALLAGKDDAEISQSIRKRTRYLVYLVTKRYVVAYRNCGSDDNPGASKSIVALWAFDMDEERITAFRVFEGGDPPGMASCVETQGEVPREEVQRWIADKTDRSIHRANNANNGSEPSI